MSVRFIHTADWQIGKPYGPIDSPDNQATARQSRIDSIHKIGAMAAEHSASFVVVAGDLFDSITPDRQTVHKTCKAVGEIGLPVYVIPGNHDHGGAGSVWHQPYFLQAREQYAPNLRVLLGSNPVDAGDAVILPCPLLRKQESMDTTSDLRHHDYTRHGDKVRIVLAHGSIQSFGGSDEDDIDGSKGAVNLIDIGQLPRSEIDYIALGDWHGAKKVADHAWYSGTHETDRFPKGQGYLSGHVLLVEASRSGQPVVTPARTTELHWHVRTTELRGEDSLNSLEQDVRALREGRVGKDLLKIEITGALGITQMHRLREMVETWKADFLHLDVSNEVIAAPTEEEVIGLSTRPADPITAAVASKLLEMAENVGVDAAIAKAALHELHTALNSK